MAPRFDPESLRLDLSVADLLESPFLRSLGFSSRGGYERLWLGQAIHGRYQEQKLAEDPSYRREVVISHVFGHRGWTVTVQGRADGVRREPDGTLVVEEIKSVRRGGMLPPAVRESYQRQAMLYAWMLSHTEPNAVRAELVLIAIGSDETEREPLNPDLKGLEVAIRRRLNALIHAWEAEQRRAAERHAAAGRLTFPYPEPRPGQELILAAREAEVCPFEVGLELSNRVQVTVCDYNYVFDPYVSLSGFAAEEDLSDVILVIDEVHNLVGRGRGYYSPELSSDAVRKAAEVVGRWGEPIHIRIENLCLKLAALIDGIVADALEEGPPGERAVQWPLPEDQFWRLRPALDATFVDYLEYQRETRSFHPDDPFVELYFNFLRFLNGLMVSDAAFSHCVEFRRGDGKLKILCKDPSRFLGAVISRTHATIGLSATLSPPEFYTGLLGFEVGRTAFVELANPFPAENRRVVIDPSVATTYRERPAKYERIAERLAGI